MSPSSIGQISSVSNAVAEEVNVRDMCLSFAAVLAACFLKTF